MGNSFLPGQINYNLSDQGWVKSSTQNKAIIWTNSQTNQQLQQYSFIVSDNEQLTEAERAYRLRYNSTILVSGKYFKKYHEQEYCSQLNKGSLYIERITCRIQNKLRSSVSEGTKLYSYKRCFEGFNILAKFAGPFDITEEMICFNKKGLIKVWLNSDLSKSLPQLRFDRSSATQFGMVRKIIDIIQNHILTLDQQTKSFKEFLLENNVKTLADGQNAVESYSIAFKIDIPPSFGIANVPPKTNSIQPTVPTRPLSSIVPHHPNNIHNQQLASPLHFQSKSPTVVIQQTPAASPYELHHSQSLLNLINQSPHQINRLDIMNYKNRSELQKQTQSLINIHPQTVPIELQKKIHQYIRSPQTKRQPQLYSKNPNLFKMEHKYDNSQPFNFSFNVPKGKTMGNNRFLNHDSQRNQNNNMQSRTPRNVRNFKSVNAAKPTSKYQNFEHLPKSPMPSFKFSPQRHHTSVSSTPVTTNLKQQQIENFQVSCHLFQPNKCQKMHNNKKVSQVYLEINQKKVNHRVNTQPASKVYFTDKKVENGLVFRNHHHSRKPNLDIFDKSHGQANTRLVQSVHHQQNHQKPASRKMTEFLKPSQLPLSFSSKYMIPNSGLVIESLKSKVQPFPIKSTELTENYQRNAGQNTYRTIKEENSSICQSVENAPNYAYDINAQILQDLHRLRANDLNANQK